MLDVREKSFSERVSLKRLNSGSSRYSGSSLRRYVVGYFLGQHAVCGESGLSLTCDSSAGDRLKDMLLMKFDYGHDRLLATSSCGLER